MSTEQTVAIHELPEGFEATFVPGVIESFVRALQSAYDSTCEGHRPAVGNNEATFGFTLYHSVTFFLDQAATESSKLLFDVRSRAPKFRLSVKDFEVGCYRVGRLATEDIWSSFPENDDAAPMLVEEQLWLPGVPNGSGVKKARNLILAHFGNPDDGLCAVYLCVPSRIEKEKISGWACAQLLWKIGDSIPQPVMLNAERVPEETVPEPQFGKIRKDREKRE